MFAWRASRENGRACGLDGYNLDEAVSQGVLGDVPSRLRVIEQLCAGLAYAHGRGVIHRDIKPSNIHLLPDGTVKVLDFGIAWLEGGTFITEKGVVLGTPSYMAPEQFTPTPIDHRVDMWAVGVILYELLSGRRPFEAKTVPSLIYKIIHAPLPPKAKEYPHRAQITLIRPIRKMHCIITPSTFFFRTSPL